MYRYLDASSHSWTGSLGILTLSLALHGAAFVSLDYCLVSEGVLAPKNIQQHYAPAEELQFEFVEAPPQIYAGKPKATKKISDRDSLNQDLTKDKSQAQDAPKVEKIDIADQIAQNRGGRAAPALARIDAVPPSVPVTPQEISKEAPNKVEEKVLPVTPAETSKSVVTDETIKEASMKVVATDDTEKLKTLTAQEPSKGSAGGGKIIAAESGKVISKGSKLYGQTSFEATGSGMGVYMKNLKEKIWLAWFPYIAFKYPQDYRMADAVISFVIDKSGEVKMLRVVESSGSPLFASFCMESIQKAGNFGALPEEILALIGKDELELRFSFRYH